VRFRATLFFAAALVLAAQLRAQSNPLARRVLVVYSSTTRESKQVAEYYLQKREIPSANLCRIDPPWAKDGSDMVSVDWNQFDSIVRNPVRKCLQKVGRDQILYIVLSFKTPYRLSNAPSGFGLSIDQYVSDIWDETGAGSRTLNPYYAEAASKAGRYVRFIPLAQYRQMPGAKHIYSVWRLDAGTLALATGLVDKAIQAEQQGMSGQACIDRKYGDELQSLPDTGYAAGDWDLEAAANLLRKAGIPVLKDTHVEEFGTPPAPLRCDNAIFYAGWYSLNHYNDAFSWQPGAIAFHIDSASAADPRGGPNWSANAIFRGLTVTNGAVGEPYLEGQVHADGLVHDLLEGANVGDAFLRNVAWLKWMLISIGDPLYKPKFLQIAH
jgi:uncharacterized protein (TIGR03790 family)